MVVILFKMLAKSFSLHWHTNVDWRKLRRKPELVNRRCVNKTSAGRHQMSVEEKRGRGGEVSSFAAPRGEELVEGRTNRIPRISLSRWRTGRRLGRGGEIMSIRSAASWLRARRHLVWTGGGIQSKIPSSPMMTLLLTPSG